MEELRAKKEERTRQRKQRAAIMEELHAKKDECSKMTIDRCKIECNTEEEHGKTVECKNRKEMESVKKEECWMKWKEEEEHEKKRKEGEAKREESTKKRKAEQCAAVMEELHAMKD
jgi:hypothetical protein